MSTSSPSTTTPTNNTIPAQMALRINEYSNPQTHFLATTAPLTSHIIIDNFEDRNKIHCPEMSFLQNSLVITHKVQNISLVFTTAESILGTIHPTNINNDENNNENENQCNTTTNNTTSTLNTTPSQHDVKSTPLSQSLPINPNADLKLFIPTSVQVKESQVWQQHLIKQQEKKAAAATKSTTTNDTSIITDPKIIQIAPHLNDWTYSTLYQGLLYHNDDNKQFFVPSELRENKLQLHNELKPDSDVVCLISPRNGSLTTTSRSTIDPDFISLEAENKLELDAKEHNKTVNQNNNENEKSDFITHIKSLSPPPNILTATVTNDDLEHIPLPELIEQIPICQQNGENWSISPIGIDYKMLSNKNELIHFYSHIILYEDELHDHGVSNYSIRIRVMNSCYYILIRNFLRVDNVIVRIRDTRYFYPFHQLKHNVPGFESTSPHTITKLPTNSLSNHQNNTTISTPSPIVTNNNDDGMKCDWLYRETKIQEATFEQLRTLKKSTNPKDYNEEFSWMTLPTIYCLNERINLNAIQPKKNNNTTQQQQLTPTTIDSLQVEVSPSQ